MVMKKNVDARDAITEQINSAILLAMLYEGSLQKYTKVDMKFLNKLKKQSGVLYNITKRYYTNKYEPGDKNE
jgi:hypothetical protein